MKFGIKEWRLEELYKRRNMINFPVYQRGEIWFEEKKILLIDSIFKGIDIPKLYLQKTDKGWDCIDGHQRINAIVGFFDGEFKYAGTVFEKLSDEQKEIFEDYKLTIALVDEISDEMIRELFIRLQLGIPANSGEKLNAIKSNIGEFVKMMAEHPLMNNVSMPSRRFAKEQVCAQICNNSMVINKTGEFRNSKYDDLENLYRAYKNFDLNSKEANDILFVLDKLHEIFSDKATEIRNRASIVSIYLLVEEMMIRGEIEGKEKILKKFYLDFLRHIKKEVKLGIDATNRFIISYQSRIIQAADSKSSIRDRHEKLKEALNYYSEHKKIMGYTK